MKQSLTQKISAYLITLTLLVSPGLNLIAQAQTETSKVAVKPVEPFYTETQNLSDKNYVPEITYLSPEKAAPIEFTSIAASWTQFQPVGTEVKLHLRFKNKSDKAFGDWYELERGIDGSDVSESSAAQNYSPETAFISLGSAAIYQYKVTLSTQNSKVTPVLQDLKFTFLNGGSLGQQATLALESLSGDEPTHFETDEYMLSEEKTEANLNSSVVASTSLSAQAETPLNSGNKTPRTRKRINSVTKYSKLNSELKIISRADWGADESLRIYNPDSQKEAKLVTLEPDFYEKFAEELKVVKKITTNVEGKEFTWAQSYPEKVEKIIIHHTATTKNLDNPAQAIRDIYYWHTISKGWGDIGYNYIIDQQGNIYEGRAGGEGVIGAHAGRGNHGSIGIALLGNYEDVAPSEAVMSSLIALVKAKSELYGIDTEGTSSFRGQNLPNIIGHRDIMKTTCPGEEVEKLLPVIRQLARSDKTIQKVSSVSDAKFALEFAKTPSILVFKPGAAKTVTLEIKNTGTQTWSSDTYFKIKTDQNSNTFLKQPDLVLSSKLGSPLSPQKSAFVTFELKSTRTSGSGVVQIYPVINGNKPVENFIALGIQVNDPPAKLKYDYELASMFYSKYDYKPGDILKVTVKLRNRGTEIWQKSGPNKIMLGADSPRDHLNTLLVKPSERLAGLSEDQVKPNQIGTFEFEIKVPNAGQPVKEVFTPVIENITWMKNRGTALEFNSQQNYVAAPVNKATSSTTVTAPASTKASSTTIVSSTSATPTGSQTVNIASTVFDTKSKPTPIRIDLAYRGNPAVISANGDFSLYEAKTELKKFSANTAVSVKYENGLFIVSTGDYSKQISSRPRLVPSSDSVIMRIDNFERRSSWDKTINNNEFRGVLEVLIYNNELHVINELEIEDYIKGIAEELSTEPEEKIKAIMIIARTYARFYTEVAQKFPGAPFHLNDDPNYSQKYLGYSFEKRSPVTTRIAKETRGMYVTYKSKLIKTPFFSRSNGKTISAFDKWGWTDTPFLQSVNDSMCQSTEYAGHGVGLSGCGAKAMALSGKTAIEIIKYYYQGVEIAQSIY